MGPYYLGIDVGAESVKVAALRHHAGALSVVYEKRLSHPKDPEGAVRTLLGELDLRDARGIAVTGRLAGVLHAPAVPTKAAMRRGVRLLHAEHPAFTVLSIGAHGFSVLEVGAQGEEFFQQNSRCSQGTGNFLSQLVQRFGLTVEEAALLVENVGDAAHLSGRCPVILKTDMTHLANKGEDKARIVAGLYDAVCDNVLTLVRPRLSPRDVILIGGVARSLRVRRTIERWLSARELRLTPAGRHDELLEAVGAATHAFEHPTDVRSIDNLFTRRGSAHLERVPPLRDGLAMVRRFPKPEAKPLSNGARVIVGLDIGSTGSKAVAVDVDNGEAIWETYLNTEGAPVQASQRLVERWVSASLPAQATVLGFGVTGSGREVAGSLLRTCYGAERVFILNEIAAHARGATSIDPDVDTIFEIGGQDAKYIRLEEGRVVDAAMNEACSAGTGSFIAEQGTKFEGIGNDVASLGRIALDANEGVSLGQHCSVFMAEVIDEAITQGVARDTIIAGLYDSIIQNYLNRVKGPRTVGRRVFCQGMPFSADALAAAVARQTGREVVVPPNPGTIGALGIALLARDRLRDALTPVDPARFLGARVQKKETIVCRSKKGCGEPGNKCRIDRLTTDVAGKTQKFLWGGNCSLYDKGAGRAKLPDHSPDVFREREELVDAVIARHARPEGAPVVAMTDEFTLKGLLPLFVTFVGRLGFRSVVARHAGAPALRKGIEGARVPYCAPMQMFHGVVFDMADRKPDFVLVPMLQELPRVGAEEHSVLCPIVQASPDLVSSLVDAKQKVLRPTIKFDEFGYDGPRFAASMRSLARELGCEDRFADALEVAIHEQLEFERACLESGARALAFCARENVVPVAVLGRPYTIYNDVLNSNVPSILRSLGALPIPVDCLPVADDLPIYEAQFWGYTQRNLRAAEQVRRTPGLYSVFCSNYACGPDSFTLRFYSYIMQGKPSAVIETDGHSGDAGTRTRMEAFLFCVDADLESRASDSSSKTDFARLDAANVTLGDVKRSQALLLVPRMGPGSELAAAALRGEGFQAESLPLSTRDDVRTGRRYTSGKECVPMMLTLGTLLERLERGRTVDAPDQQYVFFMPTAKGPCRFGVYHSLHKIVLEETGWADRVKIVSPDDADYFKDVSSDFSLRIWLGFVARDLLEAMLLDVRPVERVPGQAQEIVTRWSKELERRFESPGPNTPGAIVRQLFGGLWGTREVLSSAAAELALAKDPTKDVPTVAVVGEIYVRLDPFANDFIVDKLEARGLRVRLAPFVEWLEYTAFLAEKRVIDGAMRREDDPLSIGLSGLVQRSTYEVLYDLCAKPLGWGPRPTVRQTLDAGRPYVHEELVGEAVLTIGGPVHELHSGLIDGAVIVGPHECMPCKIAEAQYAKAAEEMTLPYVSLGFNGDPIDTESVDRFAYDVHESRRKSVGAQLPLVEEKKSSGKRRVHLRTLQADAE